MDIKPVADKKIADYVRKNHPNIFKEAEEQIAKPFADLTHFFTLAKALTLFCKKRNITEEYIKGEEKGNAHVWDRTVFLAIIFKLYSPEVFVIPEGYSWKDAPYNLRNGLREELAGMLECHPTWISQRVGSIVVWMDKNNYVEFREQVNGFVDYMKSEIRVKEVKEPEALALFQ